MESEISKVHDVNKEKHQTSQILELLTNSL
jgi:hypothetical protein